MSYKRYKFYLCLTICLLTQKTKNSTTDNAEILDVIKRIRIRDVLQLKHNPIEQRKALHQLLNEHPDIVSTLEKPGLIYHKGQTLAHFFANDQNYKALNIMWDYGETGTTPIKHLNPFDKFQRCLRSTAFLALCFGIHKRDPDNQRQSNALLSLLEKFLQRTPHLTLMPRADGVTPAIAIATQNSHLKPYILSLFASHNAWAFEGETKNNKSILDFAIQAPEDAYGRTALSLILQHKQQHSLPIQPLDSLIEVCHCQKKNDFAAILKHALQIPIYIPLETDRIDTQGNCLCCLQGCLCCQNPIAKSPEHSMFWQQWYTAHLDHPDAFAWLQQRQLQCQNFTPDGLTLNDVW